MLIQCNKTQPLIQPVVPINKQSRFEKEVENVRYCPLIKEDYVDSLYPNVKTCLDVIYNGSKLSENGDCFGYHKSPMKSFMWISYDQIIRRMKDFGAGLIALGCKASNHTKICILSINRVEWSIAQFGCYHYSMVVAPLYETLGAKLRNHIINEVQPDCLIVDNINRVKKVLDNISDTPSIKLIICMDNAVSNELENEANKYSITIVPFSKVERLGRDKPQPIIAPEPHNLAMILYTSGTSTDVPRGCLLTHRCFVASASGLAMHINCNIDIGKLTFLSLLPMSHSFEQSIQTTLLMSGARIGFFSGDIKTVTNDMKMLKPSLLCLVPRLLNRIYNTVMTEVRKSQLKSLMFRRALKIKQKEVNGKNGIMDKLVFKKLRSKLGGNVKLVASGSAPLSSTICNFFRCALGCPVVEGYGQTETAGAAFCAFAGDHTSGHVGVPLCGVIYKLVDVPDMNYYFKETKTGEILIKGSSVFIGYYKMEDATYKTFTEDGWLKTGDIGKLNENGTISIVDRKKHIFKLSQGEFVAPEKIENVYAQSSFVSQCFVDGDSTQNYLVAVVVPDIEQLNHWCNERSISLTLEEAVQNPSFKKTVFEDMLSVGVREGLNSLEQVKEIHLHNELFTIENNLLTPTMKIKRNQCRLKFKNIVKKMYNQSK